MRGEGKPEASALGRAIFTGILGYVLALAWPHVEKTSTPEWAVYAFWAGGIFFAAGALDALRGLIGTLHRAMRTFRALRPPVPENGAGWLSRKEAERAGLGGTKGLFFGIVDGLPIFIPDAVHTLLVAPARTGKTIGFVLGALCHDIGCSRIVADMKGELAVMTAALIQRLHGHRVIILNPAYKFGLGNSSYNPLQLIIDAKDHAPEDAMGDARSLVLLLIPEPRGGDRDPFWPGGARSLLVFVIVALCVLKEAFEATLPRAYEVLNEEEALEALFKDALACDALAGEVAMLARRIMASRAKNEHHFGSFREQAVQALFPFGPSGRLAASVERCDFRFRELKSELITLFMLCDYSRMDEYRHWLKLMVWAALRELVREDNAVPVRLLLDELTNYPLPGLPEALTGLGGYGIRVSMIVQELEEIVRVYGREACDTILSQTDVKQFFAVSSLKTAQMVSAMLGETEKTRESVNLGHDLFGLSGLGLGKVKAPLMTPDQIRRMPRDEQIIFIGNLHPAKALKPGIHEVDPWRGQVAGNPLHGGKPHLGTVKMILKGRYAYATHHGRRKAHEDRRPLLWPLLSSLAVFVPHRRAVLPAALVAAVLILGWPMLRVEYTRDMSWCRYYGLPLISQPLTLIGRDCPLIIWRK